MQHNYLKRNSRRVAVQTEKSVWNEIVDNNLAYNYWSDASDRKKEDHLEKGYTEYLGDSDESEKREMRRIQKYNEMKK